MKLAAEIMSFLIILSYFIICGVGFFTNTGVSATVYVCTSMIISTIVLVKDYE